jgi:hypothetical protein
MATTLWASTADRQRVEGARESVLLVGSYDGSGNFGDVLQLAGAIETVRGVAGPPLPIAVVERETHAHHTALLERHPSLLSGAAFVHYHEGGEADADGLIELENGCLSGTTALYLYGGGYLNEWWGARKVAHAAAAERLAGGGPPPVVASGLQVDEAAVAPGGVAHELLSRAWWVGARDVQSLHSMREHLGVPVELSGDDALPFLRFPPTEAGPAINLHVNAGQWVSDDPTSMAVRIVATLRDVALAADAPLELRPVIAYEDPRVSERRVVTELLAEHHDALLESGLTPGPAVDLLTDATGNGLERFRRARLTVACSYHVTLTSLLNGVPSLLPADNAYYAQKAAGLRDLFGLDRSLLGVTGSAGSIPAAIEAALDGPRREALLDRLRAGAADLAERQAGGRRAVSAALLQQLRRSRLRRAISRLRGA